MHARRAQRGFSLIELVAVLVLVGIALSLVSLAFTKSLDNAKVQAASRDLVAALRYTRGQAIVKGQQSVFEVDTRGELYRGADKRDVKLPRGLQLSVTSAASDQTRGEIARIRFFPDGSSTGGRITLRSGQREWHVNVSWLTGAITIFDTAKHS